MAKSIQNNQIIGDFNHHIMIIIVIILIINNKNNKLIFIDSNCFKNREYIYVFALFKSFNCIN
jgi:hypothetical protein